MDDIGRIPVFRSTFPPKIEEALLVLLLELRQTAGRHNLEAVCRSLDLFVHRRSLCRTTTRDRSFSAELEHCRRAGRRIRGIGPLEVIAITDREMDALQQRWHKLRTAWAKTDSERASFHPFTAHFFVKAFLDEGINEIIANISCIEATLQLPGEWTRENLMKRYQCLVNDEESCRWLDSAYRLRNRYLHSLEDPKATISFENLARARLSVVKAIDAYLDLASRHAEGA